MKNQLFVISADTWDALDEAEITATVSAMKELGIYKLPYETIDIWLPANNSFGWAYSSLSIQKEIAKDLAVFGKDELWDIDIQKDTYKPRKGSGFVFEIRDLSLDKDTFEIAMHASPGTPSAKYYKCKSTPGVKNTNSPLTRDSIAAALIVLLATRNARKETQKNKLASLGIGKKRLDGQYKYVTTISLPQSIEDNDGDEPKTIGKPKTTHLRRGHIRRQHYGPDNALAKQIWIEPVFVNADKDWTDKRERYNVSL